MIKRVSNLMLAYLFPESIEPCPFVFALQVWLIPKLFARYSGTNPQNALFMQVRDHLRSVPAISLGMSRKFYINARYVSIFPALRIWGRNAPKSDASINRSMRLSLSNAPSFALSVVCVLGSGLTAVRRSRNSNA